MKKVTYWAFEGSDGIGKTVLSKSLAEEFDAFWTYEPNGETDELSHLRNTALDKDNKNINKYAREYALMLNRIIHHHTCVVPVLANMNTLISDRSILSGLVYAKLETFTFEKYMNLLQLSNILTFPDVIIYCKNKKKKLKKAIKIFMITPLKKLLKK